MDIKGKVHEISPVMNVTESFKKRELVVEYAENPTYPEYIKFEALQDKVNLLDSMKVGDQVEVFFNLRGRAYKDKTGKTGYFNSLIVWRVNVLNGETPESNTPEYAPPANFNAAPQDDDLPF
ncbi:DUF3127 domain-containing protein [Arcticibacter eurypsychrophilus]|uniref:DUF3127 domain-containing protein n=1 Tax=Arcticibacter eurypsychrophilus TaxID=1434752 RepID=UPI00084DBD19|nr:DUF3127 domain-containing protein [Arcticibacter eurypsychrophilus]